MKNFLIFTLCLFFSFLEIKASNPFDSIENSKTTQNPQSQIITHEPYAFCTAVSKNAEKIEFILDEHLKHAESLRKKCTESYKKGEFHWDLWQTRETHTNQLKKAFDEAIELNNLKIIKLFMEKAVYTPEYALLQVTGLGKGDILEFIIQKKPKNLNNGLLQAVQYKCLKDVQVLIKNGANDLKLPLIAACGMGYLDIVKFLVKKGAKNLNEGLEMAAIGSQLNIIKYLVENGADNLKETLEEAEKWEDQDIINYLKKEIKIGSNNKSKNSSILTHSTPSTERAILYPDSSTILIPSRDIVIHLKDGSQKIAIKDPKLSLPKFKEVKKRHVLKKERKVDIKNKDVSSRPVLIIPINKTEKLKLNEHIINQPISPSISPSPKKTPLKMGTPKFKEVKYRHLKSKKNK